MVKVVNIQPNPPRWETELSPALPQWPGFPKALGGGTHRVAAVGTPVASATMRHLREGTGHRGVSAPPPS